MICPQNTKLWYMFDTHVNKLITFTPGHFYAIKLYITFLSYSKLSIWYAISFDIAEVLWYAITCTASSFFFNINSFTLIGGQLLYNIALALPYINMNPPQVYTCSPSEPPPTSLPVPSLWIILMHQPQASCILHWTWTGDSFHIWYYTCFNAILPSHPTLSLSHRVQKNSVQHMLKRKGTRVWWLKAWTLARQHRFNPSSNNCLGPFISLLCAL